MKSTAGFCISIVFAIVGATPAEAYLRYGCHLEQSFSPVVMLADINPGPDDAIYDWGNQSPQSAKNHRMIDVNGVLYFQANDGASGLELWRVAGGNPTSSPRSQARYRWLPGGCGQLRSAM